MGDIGLRDVAAQAGVSTSSASNALNRPELVSRRTARLVAEAAKQLGYVPNQAARQLRAGRSMTLGLAVMNITNPFFSELVLGAEEVAADGGFSIIVGNSYDSVEKEQHYLDLFERQRCDGVLLAPVAGSLDRLRRRSAPTVLVDRNDGGHAFPSVTLNDEFGGRLAGQHLADAGCSRILFVGGPFSVPQMRARRDGAQAAAAAAQVGFEVFETGTLNPDLGRRIGDELAERPPSARPDGIFAANDLLALGLMQSLLRRRIEVPGEVAMVGYDDIDFAASSIVPLTSVAQPAREMGRAAGRLLLDELTHPGFQVGRDIRFEPRLMARDSSRRR